MKKEQFSPNDKEKIKETLDHNIRNMIMGIEALIKCLNGEHQCDEEQVELYKSEIKKYVSGIESTYDSLDQERIDKLKNFIEKVKIPEHLTQDHIAVTKEAFKEIESLLNNLK